VIFTYTQKWLLHPVEKHGVVIGRKMILSQKYWLFDSVLLEFPEISMKNFQNLGNNHIIDLFFTQFFFKNSFDCRIFSHPNVLPVIGCCNSPPNLVVISQYMPWGSLYTLLHEGARVTVDTALALRLAVDVSRAMAFLHSLERIIPQFHLNSHHIMVYLLVILFLI